MNDEGKKNIYEKLVELLTNYCSTCLDKQRMEKILLCAFKIDLIEYANENGHIDDAEKLLESLAKTLGVSTGENYSVNSYNCSNGVCTLC